MPRLLFVAQPPSADKLCITHTFAFHATFFRNSSVRALFRSTPAVVPRISRPLQSGFQHFVRRYLRRNFHSLAINRQSLHAKGLTEDVSLVLYANHASWWDPLTAMFLAAELFPRFRMYAPIDAEALRKYPMFSRMGFFPIDAQHRRGALNFLRTSQAILRDAGASIWVTPQGRFVDPRETSAEFMPGLAHLAARLARRSQSSRDDHTSSAPVWFVAGAVEYVFWEERRPELLVWFAPPICADYQVASMEMSNALCKHEWNQRLSASLCSAQTLLAAASIARDDSQFEMLLGGQLGTHWAYDAWRSLRGWMAGKPQQLAHGDKLGGTTQQG